MTVLWLIVGPGEWFLTFLHIIPFYQTRQGHQIYLQHPQWCSFIENTNINKLLQFIIIYKNLH